MDRVILTGCDAKIGQHQRTLVVPLRHAPRGVPDDPGRLALKRPCRWGWLVAVLGVVAACAAPPAGQEAQATSTGDTVTEIVGLVYGTAVDSSGERIDLQLDLFLPGRATAEPRQTVVFVHGGGFAFGSRSDYRSDATSWAEAGWVAASVDYRLQDSEAAVKTSTAAAQAINDAGDAVRWLVANAEGYGIDPDRIVAMGGSAGGFIVLSPWLGPEPAELPVVPFPDVAAVVASGATLEAARPMIGMATAGPPALLIHHETDAAAGTDGETIDDAIRTCDAITSVEGVCQVIVLPGEGHLVSLAYDGPMAAQLIDFLAAHVRF